ncbi:hypothetical protein EDB19DRAFT_1989761 [Suillus lakei]|nr:hypothetical protein EDB19DRAFT_1989761 [Suillus lakei]
MSNPESNMHNSKSESTEEIIDCTSSPTVSIFNDLIVLNVSNVSTEWKTYAVNFTTLTPGPMTLVVRLQEGTINIGPSCDIVLSDHKDDEQALYFMFPVLTSVATPAIALPRRVPPEGVPVNKPMDSEKLFEERFPVRGYMVRKAKSHELEESKENQEPAAKRAKLN